MGAANVPLSLRERAGMRGTAEVRPAATVSHASEEVSSTHLISNSLQLAIDTLSECLDAEPNDSVDSAQLVSTPVIINGRIDRPGDRDVFRFEGRAGQQIVAEVMARRIDSPLDSVLRLSDATGQRLAINDDHEDKGYGLMTHYADSYLTATLPADGTYFLTIDDVQRQGGSEYGYRLRISEGTARLLAASDAFQHQCPRDIQRSADGLRVAQRRLHRRDSSGHKGR